MRPTVHQVLQLATSDPHRALELAGSLDGDEAALPPVERATLYRARSVANRVLGDFQNAFDLAELALAIAREADDGEQQLLAIVTMVGPMVVLGHSSEAVALLDGAVDLATTAYLRARLSYQRGVVWGMKGEPLRAIEEFDAALPAFREAADPEMVLGALRGRGLYRLAIGDLRRAREDLEEGLAIAVDRNEEVIVSGIKHSLGLLASYRGDITEALRLLLECDEIYMRLTGSPVPQHVARSDVLLSAGLFREAYELAHAIAEHHRAHGDPEHLANALLVAANAALLAGELQHAFATAEEAVTQFELHERPLDAVEARRIVIEARYHLEGASRELLDSATEVAATLESQRQLVATAQARLLAARIATDLGDVDEAVSWLEPMSRIGTGPVELRVHARVATARLRRLRGDKRGADAAARSGLRLIDDYQSALGATDLRMGMERHGVELGDIGLDLALGSGNPRRILRWMERTRARALRHQPVVVPDDEIRDALGRLRQIEAALRERQDDSRLQRERRALQEEIRNAHRLRRSEVRPAHEFDLEALVKALGDRSLLEIAFHDGRLLAVHVSAGRMRRMEMGEAEPAVRELAHVRFAMRRAARLGRAFDLGELEALSGLLLGSIRLDGEELILVPPPRLMAAPWAVLPNLGDKVVTVSPSAEMWWRSHRAEWRGDGVVIAGGPDLEMAESEVSAVAGLYPESVVLPPGSTVEGLKEALGGVSLAHIATHATFNSENPMFSSLRLGDGDLNVYDIERVKPPPATVVLSACDSGYTETRAGLELAGLTSALLSMGTRSVVASIGLVPDSPATSDLMVRFHRRLASGISPSRALAETQAETFDDATAFVAAASFVCVGA